ncbi:MAG: 16S rRNA (adenine(1518)-N(6)/adenine(1519)-N(6))-dimethyltransferase RsmA [Candidatus Paceibacterota bacterium]
MRQGARLGQHFLKHSWAARALAHALGVLPGETILEIGPGKGVLTRELLAFGPVVAIEKDEALIELLKETLAAEIADKRLTLISADIRDVTPTSLGLKSGGYTLGANIPYYITGEIIRQFLTSEAQPRTIALLIQKEVAQRITSNKESILSISVKAYGTPHIVEKVSRTQFSPPPSVDSAILAVTNISKNFFSDVTEEQFFDVVRAGFASKRKFVANNLSVLFDKEVVRAAMKAAGVSEKARAENIPLTRWKDLAKRLR